MPPPTPSPTGSPTASPTEPQTDAPSSNPSSSPTTSPSNSPTGRLDGCEEGSIVICGENDDEGIEFCLENGRNTVCLPLDFVRVSRFHATEFSDFVQSSLHSNHCFSSHVHSFHIIISLGWRPVECADHVPRLANQRRLRRERRHQSLLLVHQHPAVLRRRWLPLWSPLPPPLQRWSVVHEQNVMTEMALSFVSMGRVDVSPMVRHKQYYQPHVKRNNELLLF